MAEAIQFVADVVLMKAEPQASFPKFNGSETFIFSEYNSNLTWPMKSGTPFLGQSHKQV